MSHNKVIAVIFAGGVGSRMSHPDGPKQFVKVKDKPIIIHTLERFEAHPRVDAIYIACLEEGVPELKAMVKKYHISKVRNIVLGGGTAHESIYNGLKAAMKDPDNNEDTIVLIHDAVRPIINDELIESNINSVIKYGSAISSIPAFETVAKAEKGVHKVHSIENRDLMHVLQAPQSFWLHDIHAVNRRAEDEGMIGAFVDQAHMMKHYGESVHMIDSFRGNIKLTVPLDIRYFTFLIETGEIEKILNKNKKD